RVVVQTIRRAQSAPSLPPVDMNLVVIANPPCCNSRRRNSDDSSHSLRSRAEVGMAQEAPHKSRDLVLTDLQNDDAISIVPKFRPVKTCIAGKKSGAVQSADADDDLVVLKPLLAPVHSNLTGECSPDRQQLAL